MIQSLVNEWSSFNNITSFINEKFWEDKKKKEKLESFYNKILKKSESFINKDIENSLFILSRDFPQYIEQLVGDKILTKQKNSFIFTVKFYQNISEQIEQIWENISDKERKILIKNIILNSLQIPNNIPNKYVDFLVQTIEKNISVKKQTKKIEEKTQENKSKESKENKNTSDVWNDSENNDIILENDLDYWYPECSYIFSGWTYSIDIIWDKKIDISENEMQDFTSTALKNYIKFLQCFTIFDYDFFGINIKMIFQLFVVIKHDLIIKDENESLKERLYQY
jgi:glucan-binding YG repeat protein